MGNAGSPDVPTGSRLAVLLQPLQHFLAMAAPARGAKKGAAGLIQGLVSPFQRLFFTFLFNSLRNTATVWGLLSQHDRNAIEYHWIVCE